MICPGRQFTNDSTEQDLSHGNINREHYTRCKSSLICGYFGCQSSIPLEHITI